MVQIRSSHHKRQPKLGRCWGIKPGTIAILSIGLAVLILFSAEPVLVYDSATTNTNQQRYLNGNGASHESLFKFARPEPILVSRVGFVQRNALRTNIVHPVDVLSTLPPRPSSVEASFPSSSSLRHAPVLSTMNVHPRIVTLDDDYSFPSSSSSAIPHHNSTTNNKIQTTTTKTSTSTSTLTLTLTSTSTRRRKVPAMGGHPQNDHHREPDDYAYEFERPFLDECEPRVQPQVHPTCNNLFELDLESDISLLSDEGSWRTAWKVDHDPPVAMKLLQWKRHFDHQAYNAHKIDVIAMDLLTSSPHVVNAFGYCGQSVLTEFAPMGGREFVKSYDLKSRQRLKIARDLAQGLADLHVLQHLPESSYHHESGPHHHAPVPIFAHNDINIANTVQLGGVVKWNDFNIGVLLRAQKKNATLTCDAPVRYKADLWRSPEEIRNMSYVRLEQTDMYGFGNILYQVMTRHQPWTHKEPGGKMSIENVAARKREGRLPTIPEQYKNTTKPELQTLLLATISCYHPNPDKRLSAHDLAKGLTHVYDRLKQKKKVTAIMLRDMFIR